MVIYCEDTLTYKEQFFNDVGEVHYFSAKEISPRDLSNADALFVRSTTKVNASLLSKASQLKYVATATAGTDHLDFDYLNSKGIEVYSAAGCNAIAVAEYVIAGLFWLAASKELSLQNKSIGIVGAGNVGTALAERAKVLGLDVFLCDPPLQHQGDERHFSELTKILDCDIISLHVPYVDGGLHPTKNLITRDHLQALKPNQILVNACRGEVVDNGALYKILQERAHFHTIFDVWDSEPDINFELAQLTDIATQHIAGHSLEGKARGTEMVFNHAAEHFGWAKKSMWDYLPAPEIDAVTISPELYEKSIHFVLSRIYNIKADSDHFQKRVTTAEEFRYSRKNYGIRREFACAQVKAGNSEHLKALFGLGLSVCRN